MAAETVDGPVLILAGAGSGKTRTITYRMAHMVDNMGISPKEILAVTFTNKAAREMKERVITLLGRRKSRGMVISTFHSLGLRILKEDINKLGYNLNFSIFDPADQKAIIKEALQVYHDALAGKDKAFDKDIILNKIGLLKNKGILAEDFADSEYFDPDEAYDHCIDHCYHFYQDRLRFYNCIDFDDILLLIVRLFKEFPETAEKYSRRFKYIMIDEYQDTNVLQFEIVKGLTSTHHNLCVVGDDDQSIYAFRGADVSNILCFEKSYPEAKIIKLEENYRSTAPIIELANAVIKQNKNRRDKDLFSSRASKDLPQLWVTVNEEHEAESVAEAINEHRKAGKHLGDIAVLYRSNEQVNEFETQLVLNDIPYTIFGGKKLYDKKDIKDIMAYLYVINNPSYELALRRCLNVPSRGIGMKTLEKFLAYAKEHECTLYEALTDAPELAASSETIKKFTSLIEKYRYEFENFGLPETITNLIEDIKFYEWIDKMNDSAKVCEQKRNDIAFFINSADRFVKYNTEAHTLKDFVERLMLQDSQDQNQKDKENEEDDDDVRKNEVTLMTLHSSKGLEFQKVFLVGMEEELLPHKKTIINGEDISEERRLCYVGITRACNELIMTYAKTRKIYGKDTPRAVSRFINDFKGMYKTVDKANFGDLTHEEVEEFKHNFFEDLLANLEGK